MTKPIEKTLLVAPWGNMEDFENYLHPPLGIYRLKSCLENEGVVCDIFDPNLEQDPYPEFTNTVSSSNYELIGFSSNHLTIAKDLSLTHLARKMDDDVILMGGGIEHSINYREILKHTPPGYIIVRGEGELILQEFCQNPDPRQVPGLIWDNNGTICFSDTRSNLNRDQFFEYSNSMHWEDIPFENYWKFLESYNRHQHCNLSELEIKTVRLILSNYCSRRCKFCSTTNFLRHASNGCPATYRLPVSDVKELVLRVYNSHPDLKTIFFHDDDLIAQKRWTEEFCEMIINLKDERKLPEHISIMAQGTVRNVPYLSTDLAEAGFRILGLGVESFSSKVLKEFNKKQTVEQIHNAINSLLDVGITPYVNLILSSPDSNVNDLIITMEEALNCLDKGASVALSLYTLAFPGSDWVNELSDTELVTYKYTPIAGTSETIKLSEKILPKDPLLKEILERTEQEFNHLIKTPLPKTRIRSYLASVTLYCLLKVLKQMEIIDKAENLAKLEKCLLIEQHCL